MDKKIILAVAGSGKTYYIANDFSEKENVLLLSFTKRNINNITSEIIARFGEIPNNVEMRTFDSFVYQYLIRPFEPILEFEEPVKSRGVELEYSPETDSRNENYILQSNIKHYMYGDRFYVSRLSKLFLKQNKKYKEIAFERIEKYFDAIYIDEFQDYNGNDFKLLVEMLKELPTKLYMVGDIFQSNVAPIRNDGRGSKKPFEKIKTHQDLYDIGNIPQKIQLDKETLIKSRRVPGNICEFIRDNLKINIFSNSIQNGKIEFVSDQNEIRKILDDDQIVKLIWNNKVIEQKSIKNHINWSYSKGDTYERVCVILTDKTSNTNNYDKLPLSTKNKLYVALTRAKKEVYLIKKEDFDNWKEVPEYFEQMSFGLES